MVWSAYMVLVVGCVCVLWFPCCLSGGGGCCEAGEEGYLASVTSCLLCVCCVCVCVCVCANLCIDLYIWLGLCLAIIFRLVSCFLSGTADELLADVYLCFALAESLL